LKEEGTHTPFALLVLSKWKHSLRTVFHRVHYELSLSLSDIFFRHQSLTQKELADIKCALHGSGLTCELIRRYPPQAQGDFMDLTSQNVEGAAVEMNERTGETYLVHQGVFKLVELLDDVFTPRSPALAVRLREKVEKGALVMARCLLTSHQAKEAENMMSFFFKFTDGDQVPGSHKVLAEAQRATGNLDLARQTMERSLFRETPWDERNWEENLAYLEQLNAFSKQLDAERELQRLNEACTTASAASLVLIMQSRASGLLSWSSIKLEKQHNVLADDECDEDKLLREETENILASAASAAVRVENDEILFVDPDIEDDNCIIDRGGIKSHVDFANLSTLVFDRFKLTKAVRKWWKQGDKKLKGYFVRRLRQLAAGDRSRILQKRLARTKRMTIFETYLEQKSGFRILWTEAVDSSKDRFGIIIWYVSSHDLVARHMRRIDEAETRSTRQLISLSAVPDLMSTVARENVAGSGGDAGEDTCYNFVKLDPLADTPLNLYDLGYNDLDRMAASTWLPPLYLTTEERAIVETEETVLLLGRAGTGKTACICSRIDFDRHLADGDSAMSQLFVARSHRICTCVAETVGSSGIREDDKGGRISYLTFQKLLRDCESSLSAKMNESDFSFQSATRIDYAKFRDFMKQQSHCKLEPLIVWTQIRSFIKGSIETVTKRRALTLQEYLDTTVIGSRRCRLKAQQRQAAYAAFEKYEKFRTSQNLWDDCDRVGALVKRIRADRGARERLSRRRVYVDEIQDYSQVEIALFFLICDSGPLFLAGDPAQSVVEGVEFRFEEIRSVAHNLYSKDPNAHQYIPKKPLSVTRNFRSHTGILNVATEASKTSVVQTALLSRVTSDQHLLRRGTGPEHARCVPLVDKQTPQGPGIFSRPPPEGVPGDRSEGSHGFDLQNSRGRAAFHARRTRR
jgi:AAA domain